MKLSRRNKDRLLLATSLSVIVIALSGSSSGQTGRKTADAGSPSASSTCGYRDFTFPCPQGFKPLGASDADDLAFSFSRKERLGLFAAGFPKELTDDSLKSLVATAARKMFPKESQDFKWAGKQPPKRISKFEIGSMEVDGFNGRVLIAAQVHHVVSGDKDFLLGYIYEITRGKDAEMTFTQSLGGMFPPGCEVAVKAIYSITGEKVDKDNSPCRMEFITNQDLSKPPLP
jgi:hypothetical protein